MVSVCLREGQDSREGEGVGDGVLWLPVFTCPLLAPSGGQVDQVYNLPVITYNDFTCPLVAYL